MSKKLQGNGLFESSRMMLFEHRESDDFLPWVARAGA